MTEQFGLLVIGGGPAGFAAAKSYREHVPDRALAIVTDESVLPYERPPLTKEFLRGESGADELPLADESWLQENSVQLISGRAVSLDAMGRGVTLAGDRKLSYDTCLLATGAEPRRLLVAGVDHPRVRVVRSLHDVRQLLERLQGRERVVVAGSGFIGCEIASSLRRRGHAVTIVSDEPAPNQARLGEQAASRIAGWLRADGVVLKLGAEVEHIDHQRSGCVVVAGDERVAADVVVMSVGVTPRSELAAQTGLRLEGGAVPVDASMRSAVAGLLAAGDVCLAQNSAAGRALRVEHWGDALAHGEIAGRVAAGEAPTWDAVPGFWSTIGAQTLKYAAWGDGFDEVSWHTHPGGGFTASYGRDGLLVGVLTHDADDDYERGQRDIGAGASWQR
ncbi:MAG TPA: FAD/NAD(P)-binding oxidoreductase [Solirubrobacteraceae bacterium]|jgi:NADPH-dependent 2,4-dienoyl-CoA reductase/sulfur reductase-like enzyme|nr:FAD/NAD(P)-binding oxidoreductase [Solirubrobacteraceae bacterium]